MVRTYKPTPKCTHGSPLAYDELLEERVRRDCGRPLLVERDELDGKEIVIRQWDMCRLHVKRHLFEERAASDENNMVYCDYCTSYESPIVYEAPYAALFRLSGLGSHRLKLKCPWCHELDKCDRRNQYWKNYATWRKGRTWMQTNRSLKGRIGRFLRNLTELRDEGVLITQEQEAKVMALQPLVANCNHKQYVKLHYRWTCPVCKYFSKRQRWKIDNMLGRAACERCARRGEYVEYFKDILPLNLGLEDWWGTWQEARLRAWWIWDVVDKRWYQNPNKYM